MLHNLLGNELIDINPSDIKIENGIMIPKQFPNQVRDFRCNALKIISLENCPQEIDENFSCNSTNITSLEFVPKIVPRIFSCNKTKITSLDYAPLKCNAIYSNQNNILHLKGI